MPDITPHSSSDEIDALASALNDNLTSLLSISSKATEPSAPVAGQLWADTTNNKIWQRNAANNAWVEIGVLYAIAWGFIRKDGTGGGMTSNLAMGSNKITGLAAGTSTDDAVRKDQAVLRDGSQALTGALAGGGQRATNFADPTGLTDLVTLQFLNTRSGSASGTFQVGASDKKVTLPFAPKLVVVEPKVGSVYEGAYALVGASAEKIFAHRYKNDGNESPQNAHFNVIFSADGFQISSAWISDTGEFSATSISEGKYVAYG